MYLLEKSWGKAIGRDPIKFSKELKYLYECDVFNSAKLARNHEMRNVE